MVRPVLQVGSDRLRERTWLSDTLSNPRAHSWLEATFQGVWEMFSLGRFWLIAFFS